MTTLCPVTVTAETAVKNVISKGVNIRSVLEMGRANSRSPMVMRIAKPKNRMKGVVNIRWGRRTGATLLTMGRSCSNLG